VPAHASVTALRKRSRAPVRTRHRRMLYGTPRSWLHSWQKQWCPLLDLSSGRHRMFERRVRRRRRDSASHLLRCPRWLAVG